MAIVLVVSLSDLLKDAVVAENDATIFAEISGWFVVSFTIGAVITVVQTT